MSTDISSFRGAGDSVNQREIATSRRGAGADAIGQWVGVADGVFLVVAWKDACVQVPPLGTQTCVTLISSTSGDADLLN